MTLPSGSVHECVVVQNVVGQRETGTRLRLRIIEWLGGGAEASVYKVEIVDDDGDGDGHHYSLKVFSKRKHAALREGEAIRKGNEVDGIARFLYLLEIASHDRYAGGLGVLMHYIDGKPLTLEPLASRELEGVCRPLARRDVYRLGRRLFGIIEELHAANVIHGDVKPENIIIPHKRGYDQAVLIDFGIARIRTDADDSGGQLGKTDGYAPTTPGLPSEYIDVHACAVTLYRCLTGIWPDRSMDVIVTRPGSWRWNQPRSYMRVLRRLLAGDAGGQPMTAKDARRHWNVVEAWRQATLVLSLALVAALAIWAGLWIRPCGPGEHHEYFGNCRPDWRCGDNGVFNWGLFANQNWPEDDQRCLNLLEPPKDALFLCGGWRAPLVLMPEPERIGYAQQHYGDEVTACFFDGAECQGGECRCPAGHTECGESCLSLEELGSDRNNCGMCGNRCTDGACVNGKCIGHCDRAGMLKCGNRGCIDPHTNPELCGSIDDRCEDLKRCDERERCVAGQCECPPDMSEHDTLGCVDTNYDRRACGEALVACASGHVCAEGTCQLECPQPLALCDSECVNFATDEFNCGDCGKKCRGGRQCVNGSCECPAGWVQCGGECVDPENDRRYCGAKPGACEDLGCKGGDLCEDGVCKPPVCPGGYVACDLSKKGAGHWCVDPRTDSNYCGTGSSCGELKNCATQGKVCNEGKCECPAGYSASKGRCLKWCGEGKDVCNDDQACVDGKCLEPCADGKIRCDGECRSPADYCGGCQKCGAGQRCVDGSCEAIVVEPEGGEETGGQPPT